MLYLSEETAAAIRSLDEHWDGRGMPDGLRGRGRSRCSRASSASPRRSRSSTRRAASRRPARWRDAGAGAGSTRALVDALLRRLPRPLVLAHARAPRRVGLGAGRADAARRRRPPRPDRRGVRARDRRQVARSPPATPSASRRSRSGSAACCASTPSTQRDLRRAGLLHDVGKLAISNLILDKPGRLTDAEFARVKRAPGLLARDPPARARASPRSPRSPPTTTSASTAPATRADWVPRSSTCRCACSVADVYEALTAERPYRAALPVGEALEIVSREVPGRLDARRLRRARDLRRAARRSAGPGRAHDRARA